METPAQGVSGQEATADISTEQSPYIRATAEFRQLQSGSAILLKIVNHLPDLEARSDSIDLTKPVEPRPPVEELRKRAPQLNEQIEQTAQECVQNATLMQDQLAPQLRQVAIDGSEGQQQILALLEEFDDQMARGLALVQQGRGLLIDYHADRLEIEHSFFEAASAAAGRDITTLEEMNAFGNLLSTRMGNLGRERLGLGVLINRREISRLSSLHSLQINQYIEGLNLDINQAKNSFEFENGVPRRLESAHHQVFDAAIEKLLDRADVINGEVKAAESFSSALSEEFAASLSDQFVAQAFEQYIHEHPDTSQLDPGQREEAAGVIRDSLDITHNIGFLEMSRPTGVADEEDKKTRELRARIDALSPDVRSMVEGFLSGPLYGWDSMSEMTAKMEQFVFQVQGVEQRNDLAQVQQQFYEQIAAALKNNNSSSGSYLHMERVRRRLWTIQDLEDQFTVFTGSIGIKLDYRVWETFRTNPEVITAYGQETLDKAQGLVLQRMAEELSGPDPSLDKTKILMENRRPEQIPLLILNCFRNCNQQIRRENVDLLRPDISLDQFITSLTAEELSHVTEQNIPGVMELINLIREHPKSVYPNARERTVHGGDIILDVANQEVESRVFQIVTHCLEQGVMDENFLTRVLDAYNQKAWIQQMLHREQTGVSSGVLIDSFMRKLIREQSDLSWSIKLDMMRSITPEKQHQFSQSLGLLSQAMSTGKLDAIGHVIEGGQALNFLVRQPERIQEILDLPTNAHYLFNVLLQPGGPLYSNRDRITDNIFSNGSVTKRAKEIEAIFSKKVPYWRQLYLFTEARLGPALASSSGEYPVSMVGGTSLRHLVERHQQSKVENPDKATRLETALEPKALSRFLDLAREQPGAEVVIPFRELHGEYKKLVFRDMLRTTIESSRNEAVKSQADQRNRSTVLNPLTLIPGTYIHGSAVDYLDSVLLNGNLPTEALGENAGSDSYPFHVDFSSVQPEDQEKSPSAIIAKSISNGFGDEGKMGSDGQLFYIYQRNPDSYEAGKVYVPSTRPNHTLILAGMPSTEISAIVLRNGEAALELAKRSVLDNGFFIPVYDFEGKLLMTPDEYDQARADHNMEIPVAIWDSSLKVGEQLGSNPGGQYMIPTERGPQRFYVKFASPEGTDQIWNEQLADAIYRHMGINVPNTSIVRMDGSLGHASQMVAVDEQTNVTDLKDGFIMDALLANWDIVANSANVISSGGHVIRIDNGGALLFRARGGRKDDFNGVVSELESMRNGYPGLTPQDIQKQVEQLRQGFTDQSIDQLVDGVRLSQENRDLLRQTLRQRRDYVLSYYQSGQAESTVVNPETRGHLEQALRADQLDDQVLTQLVPQWARVTGGEGYQHNKVLLGDHIRSAIATLKYLPEYWSLSEHDRNLALVATLFHDIAKPTGRKEDQVIRDFDHEMPSAQMAAQYLKTWGYTDDDIQTVVQVIINDGLVSDIARGKVRDQSKSLTPEQLRQRLPNPSAVNILRAVNRADVVATVGVQGFQTIEPAYAGFFDQMSTTSS